MATAPILPNQDAIVSAIEIAAPPERVFRALTDPEQLMVWWTAQAVRSSSGRWRRAPGGRWRFATEPGDLEVNGVREFKASGEILE